MSGGEPLVKGPGTDIARKMSPPDSPIFMQMPPETGARTNARSAVHRNAPKDWQSHKQVDGEMDKYHSSHIFPSRRSTCVTLALLTPKYRASAARFSNLPESSSDW